MTINAATTSANEPTTTPVHQSVMEGSFPLRNLINVRTERNRMAAGHDSRVPVVASVRFDATAFATSILAGNRRARGRDVDHSPGNRPL
jgi:hypothetical protein